MSAEGGVGWRRGRAHSLALALRMPLAACLIGLAVAIVCGCDPVWSYGVDGASATHGHDAVRTVGDGTISIRPSASVFTTTLTVSFRISNFSTGDVVVDTTEVHVADSTGHDIGEEPIASGGCSAKRGRVVIPVGAECTLDTYHRSGTLPDRLHPFEAMTLRIGKIEHGGVSDSLSVGFAINTAGTLLPWNPLRNQLFFVLCWALLMGAILVLARTWPRWLRRRTATPHWASGVARWPLAAIGLLAGAYVSAYPRLNESTRVHSTLTVLGSVALAWIGAVVWLLFATWWWHWRRRSGSEGTMTPVRRIRE